MKVKVFVDGQEGTTGLQIRERLAARGDVEILTIDPAQYKDPLARKDRINSADIVFLCLPDDAARESVSLVESPKVRIIDASTAHRIDPEWTYGFPEMEKGQRAKIAASKRVSVPGCYATGFAALTTPLVKLGILPQDYPVTCHAISGYSGAGKKAIALYEAPRDTLSTLHLPRHYALGMTHKHLPEMHYHSGLKHKPIFNPIIADYYKGMVVVIPLFTRLLHRQATPVFIQQAFSEYYKGERFVKVLPYNAESNLDNGQLIATTCNGTNRMELMVFGNEEQLSLVARLDNLGKGASGAAVQNMNLMLGLDEGMGLE